MTENIAAGWSQSERDVMWQWGARGGGTGSGRALGKCACVWSVGVGPWLAEADPVLEVGGAGVYG